MPQPNASGWVFTGKHMLLSLIAFFGIILAVNVAMISMALSTHSGIVANEPYRKGLKYNERIEAGEKQHALGWTDDIAFAAGGREFVVNLTDKDAKPVRGLKVSALVGRPSTDHDDLDLTLEEVAPGRYEAKLPADMPRGNFVASVNAVDASQAEGSVVYRARKRLWLER